MAPRADVSDPPRARDANDNGPLAGGRRVGRHPAQTGIVLAGFSTNDPSGSQRRDTTRSGDAVVLVERLRVGISHIRECGDVRLAFGLQRRHSAGLDRERETPRCAACSVPSIRSASLCTRDGDHLCCVSRDLARPIRDEPARPGCTDHRCRSRGGVFRPAAPHAITQRPHRSDPGENRAWNQTTLVSVQRRASAVRSTRAAVHDSPGRVRVS